MENPTDDAPTAEALRLPAGAPDIESLRAGTLPPSEWSAQVATDLSPDLLVLLDPLLRAVWTNGAVERVLGIRRGELLGTDVSDHVHADDIVVALGALNEVHRHDGYHIATRVRVRRGDGSYLDTRVTASTISDASGVWTVLALRPVDDEVAVERRRAQLKALAQTVYVECASVHWYELGERVPAMLAALAGVAGAETVELAEPRNGVFTTVASWARRSQRWCGTELQVLADLDRLRVAPCVVSTSDVHPADDGRLDSECFGGPGGNARMVVEMWLDRDGVVRLVFDGYAETWDDANADIVALMCSTMLATMRRCEQESELNVRATHDPLTRLLNRAALQQRLSEMLTAAESGRPPVVLFADLNHFKQLNDRFGHREGDTVLCRVADAISSQVRPTDVAARIGGDEFVVVFDDIEVPVESLVQRVRSAVDAAVSDWPDVTVAVGAVAVEPGDHPDDVLEAADRAMYADKARLRDLGAAGAATGGMFLRF